MTIKGKCTAKFVELDGKVMSRITILDKDDKDAYDYFKVEMNLELGQIVDITINAGVTEAFAATR